MRQGDEQNPDDGRSQEREEQDRLLDREARRESWLTRLWRHRSSRKGRPDPGSPSNERPRRSG